MNDQITIEGTVAAGFEGVRDAFEENFRSRGDRGSACAVYVAGRKVVDLWGGTADEVSGRPWTEDTLSLIWSATKGAAAMCVHLLVQRGDVDLDRPVADYWPEFAAGGKAGVPVRMLLDHQVGLPYVDGLTLADLLDGRPVVEALAAQAPIWEPGSTHGYHGITYGYLVGELVRRVSGRSLGRFFADEIAGPLGLDFWIGLPEALEPRVARIVTVAPGDPSALGELPPGRLREMGLQFAAALADPTSLTARALTVGGFAAEDFNRPDVHAAELPWGNGICDARSLARLYASCVGEVDGVRLLSEETIRRATEPHGDRPDAVLFYPTRWALGFMRPHDIAPWTGPGAFGHSGAGGHVGLGDLDHQIGFAYTMTKMFGNLVGDPRPGALIAALESAL